MNGIYKAGESFKWDTRFLDLAQVVSKWSKDPSTQVGAVIVRPDKSILSIGYNGFPRKMEDTLELLNSRDEKYSRIIHAEINALLQAKTDLTGCTLYTYPFMCCDRCAVQMIQSGIETFVFPKATDKLLERWAPIFEKTLKYFTECKVEWREY
jgi:dCMP deaminase